MSQLTRVGIRLAVLTLIGAVLGLAAPASDTFASVLQQGEVSTVSISPPDETIGCDETITLDVRINDVQGLYGVDFRISYDPSIVEVVDASGEAVGVQIAPGTFPDVGGGAGLIQINSVDTGSGVVSYAATLINPSPPEPGTSGVAAQITFKGVAAGSSDIAFVSVMLSDQPARPLEATPIDGRLTVRCDGSATDVPETPDPNETPDPGNTPDPRPTRIGPGPGPGPGPRPRPGGDKPCHHLVASGNTLYSLARQYGTTVSAFMSVNKLKSPDWIYIGQKLVIPGCDGHGQPGPGGPGPGHGDNCRTHIIKYGETLYSIALNSGDSVHGLATRNGIVNPEMIWAGQRISVCPGGGYGNPAPYPTKPGCSSTHVVKPGETLIGISLWYGHPVHVLAHLNNLVNPNLIYSGMTLCIP